MKVGITCSVLTFKTITKRQFVVKDSLNRAQNQFVVESYL